MRSGLGANDDSTEVVKACVDAALLGSLLSAHWRDVLLPSEALTLPATPGAEDSSTRHYQQQQQQAVNVNINGSSDSSHTPPPRLSLYPSNWYGTGLHTTAPANKGLLSAFAAAGGGPPHTHSSGVNRIESAATSSFSLLSLSSCPIEVVSAGFLAEPLLGGASMDEWTAELRRAAGARVAAAERASDAAAVAASSTGGSNGSNSHVQSLPSATATFHVCIPFSTLFQLNREAHLRSSSSDGSIGNTDALSLQERRARQTLLQAIHQVFQLQHDLARLSRNDADVKKKGNNATTDTTRGAGMPSSEQQQQQCQATPPPLLSLHVWSPSQEFDALCDLPRVRPMLSASLTTTTAMKGIGSSPSSASSLSSSSISSLSPSAAATLSLAVLCEQQQARIVYLTRYAALQQQRKEKQNSHKNEKTAIPSSFSYSSPSSSSPPQPLSLLTHGSELRTARALGAPLVRERSTFPAWRQQRHAAGDGRCSTGGGGVHGDASGNSSGSGGGSSRSFAAHQQAWRGCGEMIRRMTAREENIRQSFTQH